MIFSGYFHWCRSFCIVLVMGGALFVEQAAAQAGATPVPRNAMAEVVFEQGLQTFEAENYPVAFERFREVYEDYGLHRKTTAAYLMAGKALYRSGEYQHAVDLLSAFLRDYPTSGYRAAAGRTLGFAQQKLREAERVAEAVNLGIALPLSRDDAPLTQALFNGIRLAVDEYNRNAEQPVRMVFRDTKNTASGARQAVAALVGEEVEAIIGPLYSDEAFAAARAAEEAGVVLVAPLATDEGIAQGRRYVFQANPPISQRGALMADLAVNDLNLRRVGIAAEGGNPISERMAEGFQEEAARLGADVTFFELLSGSRDWAQLPDLVGSDMLASVDALYLPIYRNSDRDAHRLINETLESLSRLPRLPRILGDAKWHGLTSRAQASVFNVTYADVFYVDEARDDVKVFKSLYRSLSDGQQPGRLAYVGYDVARYLTTAMASSEILFPDALREAERYEGLGTRIEFNEDNTNEALFFLHYTDGAIRLMQ